VVSISQEHIDSLFEKLLQATKKRRPQLCLPLLDEIKNYHLQEEDQKLFEEVSLLIRKYKFDDARNLLNAK